MSRFSSLHRPVILAMSKVPDRWNRYSPHGTPVRGTPFVPFKVPLSDAANVKLPHYARWSVEDLLTAFPKIKTIIDLTGRNYYHYVEPDQARKSTFRKQYGVRLEKLSFTVGFPSREQLGFFFRIIDEHIDEFGEDSQIGIHCTHGVNRTGFMVCRYMIERNRVNASDAIKAFNTARGHALEREYYLKRLQDVSEIFAKSSSSDSIKSKKLQQQLEALEAQSKVSEHVFHQDKARRHAQQDQNVFAPREPQWSWRNPSQTRRFHQQSFAEDTFSQDSFYGDYREGQPSSSNHERGPYWHSYKGGGHYPQFRSQYYQQSHNAYRPMASTSRRGERRYQPYYQRSHRVAENSRWGTPVQQNTSNK